MCVYIVWCVCGVYVGWVYVYGVVRVYGVCVCIVWGLWGVVECMCVMYVCQPSTDVFILLLQKPQQGDTGYTEMNFPFNYLKIFRKVLTA